MGEALSPDARIVRWRVGPHLRLVAVALTAAFLVVLVVLASRSFTVPGGVTQADPGPVIAIFHAVQIIGIAVELLALVLLIVFFRLKRRRKDDEDQIYFEPPRLHWAVKLLIVALPLLVFGGLIYVMYAFRPTGEAPELAPIALPPSLPARGGFVEQVSANLGLAWWEVLIAVALASLALVAVMRALRTPAPVFREEPEPRRRVNILATAVTAGLRDARRERDPRRAVIAAYATMEHILAAHGLPRREVEAPLEYMARLFGELGVGSEAIRTLTELFELARYSQHIIVPAMKEQAISALTALNEELQSAP